MVQVFHYIFITIGLVGIRCFCHFQQYFSYIVAFSFIVGGKSPTCRKSLTNFITCCCIEHISSCNEFELETLVVICTHCIGRCKSNYHTITTTTIPYITINYSQYAISIISQFNLFVYFSKYEQTRKYHQNR